MPDMLVKLYALPDLAPLLARQREAGIDVRRGLALEKEKVANWVRQTFSDEWANECEVAFCNRPVSCFIAVEEKRVAGFSCYDATYKNFVGPIGVGEQHRERGIGKTLLVACLQAMAAQGYAYAIIGGAGPTEFYAKAVGAVEIEGSTPGIYRGALVEEWWED
jgi:GNAT superfamily N-acetyltransferase